VTTAFVLGYFFRTAFFARGWRFALGLALGFAFTRGLAFALTRGLVFGFHLALGLAALTDFFLATVVFFAVGFFFGVAF
jgi:hypothetical protein